MIQGNFLKIPETNDRGSIFCPAISESLTILDTHSHDGLNSPKISTKELTKPEIILQSANWTMDGGDYKQMVTLPAGYLYDNSHLKFIINSGADIGSEINPTVKKVGINTFEVFIMSNTVDLKVVVV